MEESEGEESELEESELEESELEESEGTEVTGSTRSNGVERGRTKTGHAWRSVTGRVAGHSAGEPC